MNNLIITELCRLVNLSGHGKLSDVVLRIVTILQTEKSPCIANSYLQCLVVLTRTWGTLHRKTLLCAAVLRVMQNCYISTEVVRELGYDLWLILREYVLQHNNTVTVLIVSDLKDVQSTLVEICSGSNTIYRWAYKTWLAKQLDTDDKSSADISRSVLTELAKYRKDTIILERLNKAS
jgi:hypothetical protein